MTPLEVASGAPMGHSPHPAIPSVERPADGPAAVIRALEDVLRPALLRPPCVVAFSGGRDSSILLAVADRLARRESLPRPVALTARFPGDDESDETRWQEQVIADLGVEDWERWHPETTWEVLGEPTMDAIRRHGPMWPPNLGLMITAMPRAAGGTYVDGVGGDEVFSAAPRARVLDLLTGRSRPRPRDVRPVAAAAAPVRLRAAVMPGPDIVGWLAPDARRAWERIARLDAACAPTAWDRSRRWAIRSRYLVVAQAASHRIASDAGTTMVRPFLDPMFVGTLAATAGWRGYGSRSATVNALFARILPPDLVARRTKAVFSAVYLGPESRRIALRVIDEHPIAHAELVDREALRAEWSKERPSLLAATVVQASMLEAERRVSSV